MNFNTGFNDHQCKQCEMSENPLSRRFKHAPDLLVELVRSTIFDHLYNLILYEIGEKVIRSEEDIITELELIGETKIHQWMRATKHTVNQRKTSKASMDVLYCMTNPVSASTAEKSKFDLDYNPLDADHVDLLLQWAKEEAEENKKS